MRRIFRCALYLVCFCFVFSPYFFCVHESYAQPPFTFSSSTQFLWGDDELGDGQDIIAQYMRFSYNPEGKTYSLTGYGRLWKDLGSPGVRDDNFNTRLYYLYLDYTPLENMAFRLGRQFVNFSGGSAIVDGGTVNVSKIGPLGVTLAGGREVVYSLDSEYSQAGNYLFGIDIHLENIRSVQAGVSYVRKYVNSDLAREEFGGNFRFFYKFLSPYAQVNYDRLAETFDEQTYGIDIFPLSNLMIKGEYYQVYPTFDATSIYSVFAVDRYQEYLVRAEYSLNFPVTPFVSYKKQVYEEADNANVYSIGARIYPIDNLSVNAAFNYRMGYSGFDAANGNTKGKLVGYELNGNYKFMKVLTAFAGLQYNTYNRPELNGLQSATRYWGGGQWAATKNMSVTARIENNINENFDHRWLGRVSLDWNL